MHLTFGLNDLDRLLQDTLSYDISLFDDYNGIIDIFSIWYQQNNEPSNENIHLYLDIRGFDKRNDGDEHFTVYRVFRGVRRCPSEVDSYEELRVSEIKTLENFSDFIHSHMRSKANA